MRIALGLALALVAALTQMAGAQCRPDVVELSGARGVVQFSVAVATTEAARERGLMDRHQMPADAGMLFVYPRPQRVYFWMHDTYIPLDMLFADATGRVTRVYANARPMDDRQIDGGPGVLAVLEINAGLAARLGIGRGSVLRSPYLDQGIAAWPCGN